MEEYEVLEQQVLLSGHNKKMASSCHLSM